MSLSISSWLLPATHSTTSTKQAPSLVVLRLDKSKYHGTVQYVTWIGSMPSWSSIILGSLNFLGVNMGHVVRGQDVESVTEYCHSCYLIFDTCSAEERAGCADGDVQTKCSAASGASQGSSLAGLLS